MFECCVESKFSINYICIYLKKKLFCVKKNMLTTRACRLMHL